MGKVFFHLAIPVLDLAEAKRFYVDKLGCSLGRETGHSAIFNFAGTQLIVHQVKVMPEPQKGIYPRHFGLSFTNKGEYESFLRNLQEKGIQFEYVPRQRHPETPAEHTTCFVRDPSDNLIEFKYYINESAIMEEQGVPYIGDVIE